MIIVNGHLTIDPAQRDAAEAAIAAAVAATRAEPGNVDYRFSADLAEPIGGDGHVLGLRGLERLAAAPLRLNRSRRVS